MVPVCSAVCMGQTLVTARRQWYLSVALYPWALPLRCLALITAEFDSIFEIKLYSSGVRVSFSE